MNKKFGFYRLFQIILICLLFGSCVESDGVAYEECYNSMEDGDEFFVKIVRASISGFSYDYTDGASLRRFIITPEVFN